VADGPRVLATDGKWRIVRVEDGERVTNVLEKHDGFDALGCERWKEINVGTVGDSLSRQLREWIVQHALTCPRMKESHEPQQSE
jgi:hypothetical protein